ncbi:MAG: hypothetical protein GY796_27695 [Chloroflexi bacterium]|nr:hypothetical protein [Chloroflexota bacterium]
MTHLTVATINVRNRFDRWRQRRHLLVAQLVDAAPDLVSFQEVNLSIGQGRWLRNQINARLPEGKRSYTLVQKRNQSFRNYTFGVAVLSNLPIVYHDAIGLGMGGQVALRANIELPTRQTVDFVAVQLHDGRHNRETREEQAMALTGWLHEARAVPGQIVAGDFNETPSGLAIQYMKQYYRSLYELVVGREPIATYPTALVSVPDDWTACLDYIFVSKTIRQATQAAIFCNQPDPEEDILFPSDHVGLIATIKI